MSATEVRGKIGKLDNAKNMQGPKVRYLQEPVKASLTSSDKNTESKFHTCRYGMNPPVAFGSSMYENMAGSKCLH